MSDDPALDIERFEQRYASSSEPGPLAVEFDGLGTDYRATGYTTREQADELRRLLQLRPDSVLLDVGAGCGWPGIYLAATSGCSVISTDPVPEGAAASRARIDADGLGTRALALVATGERLPIRPGSVDAVVHVDVMC